MSFYGPDETASHQDFCNQYKTRLDIVGLGLTALELLCATALSSSYTWGADSLRGSWRRLFTAWETYREEVTRWHTMIFRVFSEGGDIGPLYKELGQERVVGKVAAHIAKVRALLRACTARTEDAGVKSLLTVLAEMIDEGSSMGLKEAVDALGGPCPTSSPPVPTTFVMAPWPRTRTVAPPPSTDEAHQRQQPLFQWHAPPAGMASYHAPAVPPPTKLHTQTSTSTLLVHSARPHLAGA